MTDEEIDEIVFKRMRVTACRRCDSPIELYWRWSRPTESGKKFVSWGVCAECAAEAWNKSAVLH